MGQSSSKKRKSPVKESAKLSKDKRDNQVFELYNNNDKHNVVKFDDNTSNDDFSFSLSGDLNKEKLLCLRANSKDKFKDAHKCKYEVIKAISTSAKLRNKNNLKKNYNLSIQTFRGDAVEYLLDVPYSNCSSVELDIKNNPENYINNSSTHSKIDVNTLFTINKDPIVPYNFNRSLTKRKQITNRNCLESSPHGETLNKTQQNKNRPCLELDPDEGRGSMKSQQIKNRPRLELPSDSMSSDNLNESLTNVRQNEERNQKETKNTNKKLFNTSMCSFCGYFIENSNIHDSRITYSSKETTKPKKTYFYRCPVCQHLIESKNKKKMCNDVKPQKLSSLLLIDSDFACKLNTNGLSCVPTSTKEFNKTGNLTEYFQTFQEFYLNDSVGSTLTSSKSYILDDPKLSTKNVKEKSVMCKLKCSKHELEHDVTQNSIKLPPASSVLLLPSRSHKKVSSMKWESILPKLINMPKNKVLYVVEVNRSDQKTQNKPEKKSDDVSKQMSESKLTHLRRIKHKYVQIPSKCHGINYKSEIGEDASSKVVKKLEQTYNVKLKTLNEFLMQQPKYLISLLMNGKIPRQRIDYKPVKIPFDCKKFTMFLSSGV